MSDNIIPFTSEHKKKFPQILSIFGLIKILKSGWQYYLTTLDDPEKILLRIKS